MRPPRRWPAAVVVLAALAAAPAAAQGPPCPEPGAALAALEVVPGNVVELVAAEPLVFDPVALCWDAAGRLHVAEMADYPLGDGGGRVVVLDDVDGDGLPERRSVLAEGIPFPNGLLPWRGGVLVTSAPDILWLRDADGDGRAEIREVVLTGFAPGNQQLRVNGLVAGPDGWVYAANGRSGGMVTSPRRPAEPVAIDRHDLRFRPDNGAIEPVAGFSQFGLAIDPFGERYSNWNTAPFRHVVFPLDVALRHPLAAPPSDMEPLPDPLLQDRLFPRAGTPATFNREPTDSFNASCGIALDSGALLEPPGCLYVCEPLLSLVHRRAVVPHGATVTARRPPGEEGREFLASRDPWFRPVFAASGPDGALYVADFCRRWVEHPDFVRPERRAGVAWDEGRDRGRIWRVRPAGRDLHPVPRMAGLAPEALVATLDAPVGWVRATALRVLGESPPEAVRAAIGAADTSPRRHAPEARAGLLAARHAVGLPPGDARHDPDPRVRRLAARLGRGSEGAMAAAADADAGVRFEEVLAAEPAPAAERGAFLLEALRADPADPWVDAAAVCVAGDAAPGLVAALAAAPGPHGPRRSSLLRTLAATCAADDAASAALSAALERTAPGSGPLEIVAGWLRARRAAGTPLGAGFGGEAWEAWFGRARSAAAGGADRGAAIAVLAADPSAPATGALVGVLAAPAGAEEVAAVVAALRGRDDPAVAVAILDAWPTATPAVRRELLEGLLARPERIDALLAALGDGRVAAPDIDPESRGRLGEVLAERPAAAALLGPAPGADRRGIVAAAEAGLPASGSVERGREVFGRHCAGCHRAGTTGARVGPDLGGVGAKERGQLLDDILDPNRSVTGEYAAVTILTHDGVAITGLPAGETPLSVSLRRQGGAVEEVARRDIESLRGTGRSLMPEGFEQTLAPADLADLIAFLRGRP